MIRTSAALVAAVIALAGCGGDANVNESVCDEFAAHAKAGLPAGERVEVVRSISEVEGELDEQLARALEPLQNAANENDSAYQLAADTFAQACFDIGWDG